jgi:hypothetical protein
VAIIFGPLAVMLLIDILVYLWFLNRLISGHYSSQRPE